MTNNYPLGFNAVAPHGRIGDESYYLDVCRQMQSAFQMVVSNPDLASKVYDICEGKTEVIYRSYSSDDNTLWRTRSAQAYGEELIVFKDTRLWLHGLNEPNPVNSNEVAYRNQWLVNLIEYVCGVHGRKLIVGNFASGSWNIQDIDAGLYDNLLQTISKYRHICHLGLHEYSAILLPMTFDSIQKGIRDRGNVQPEDWLYLDHTDESKQLPDYRATRLDWMYHLFRLNWLEHRCKTINIDPIPIVLTEFGTDRLQDVDGENGIYEHFKNSLGVPTPYAAPHGFYSNYKVWSWYWQQWSTTEALFHQLQWSYLNYPPEWVKGILLFMWSYDEEFSTRGFNLAPDRQLHNMLISDSTVYHNAQPIPDPQPEPTPMPNTIDLARYMVGDGRTYRINYNWDGGDKWFVNQTQIDGGYFYHVKGHDISSGFPAMNEQLWYDNDFIYRGADLSPSVLEMYYIETIKNGDVIYGGEWINRFVQVGDYLTTIPRVTFKYKSDDQNVPGKDPYFFEHTIKVHAVYDRYTFQSGITLNNVVELHGMLGGDSGINFEQYFYAVDYGLVGWNAPTIKLPNTNIMWQSWIAEYSTPATLVKQTLDWFTFPARPPLPPLTEPQPEIPMEQYQLTTDDERWQEATLEPLSSGSIRVRQLPATGNTPVVTTFSEIRVCFSMDIYADMPDGRWHPVKLSTNPDDGFDNGTFDTIGWVRNDVGRVTLLPDNPSSPEPEPEPNPDTESPLNFWYQPPPEFAYSNETLLAFSGHLLWLADLYGNLVKLKNGEIDGIVIKANENTEETP